MNVISAGLDKSATDAANAAKIVPPPLWTYKVQLMTPVYHAGRTRAVQCGLATSASGAGKVGMKVTDSTRSQGNMAVTYSRCLTATGRNWARAIQAWHP